MKALVTGGAGFIGSHLVERLLDAGHQVIAVDDLSTGKVDNLDAALGRYGFLLRVADVLDSDALADCFTGVDWVFHLAGLGDELDASRRPRRHVDAHVQATLQALECSRHFGVRSFVYAGSASVYAPDAPLPVHEDAPRAPSTPHAVTKSLGEDLVLHWARLHALPACSLRLFNVYGPRAPLHEGWGGVVPVFLAQRAAGRALTVSGDGTQSRDFVHVEDVCRALVRAAEESLSGCAVNVGSGTGTSIARLAGLVGGGIVAGAERAGERRHVQADVRRAREHLGWEPLVALEEGIADLVRQPELWSEGPVWSEDAVQRRQEEALLGGAPPASSLAGAFPLL